MIEHNPSMAPIIAIVDDEPEVRGSLASLLRSAGMIGLVFASGEDLLASDDWSHIRCVVTDLHMPGMSGIALQTEMIRRGFLHPTIIMTAYPTRLSEEQARVGGAAAFMTKPVDPDALLAAICEACGRAQR